MLSRLVFGVVVGLPLLAGAGEPVAIGQSDDSHPQLYPFRQPGADGKWGYIDATGAIVVKPKFRQALDFEAGRARVTEKDKVGYINEQGQWVFTLPEDLAFTRPFSEGVAAFCIDNMYDGKWGYLDRDGDILVQPKYDKVGDFTEGLARVNMGAEWEFPGVRRGGKWGFINKTGQVVIDLQFDGADDYSGGQASVVKDGRRFHIDSQGREVANPKPKAARTDKHDVPHEVVRTTDGQVKQTNDREPFRGDLARVHIGGAFSVADDGPAEWAGGAWYYVNRKGQIVRQVRHDSEGMACGYGREDR